MKQRGRKSAEDLVVIEGGFGIPTRPDPPEILTDRQKEIWAAVVRDEPAEFFQTAATKDMLKDYCIHRATSEGLSGIINDFQIDWVKSKQGRGMYRDLLKMRDMEDTACTRLATKLRITNQSRYKSEKAATMSDNTAKGLKPWEL